MRPLLNEFTVTMPRGAAVVYPKDAADLDECRHLFRRPGAGGWRWIRRSDLQSAACDRSRRAVDLYERREDFAAIARRNVENFFGASPPSWDLRVPICSSRS